MLKSLRWAALAALAIVATSCGSSGDSSVTPPPSPSVASVTVTGSVTPLTPGGTTTLSATAYTSSGSAVAGASFTWSSSNNAIATVSQSGVVTAVAPGTASITAADGAVTGTFTITVTAAVATVALSAPKTTLAPGDSETITVTLRDASGNALTGRSVTWQSSASSVATVSNAGVVNAIAAGSVTITATSEGKSSTITLTVVASSLIEQHIVAQQGFAIALASTVLQSQLQTLITLIVDDSGQPCTRLVGGGSIKRSTAFNAVPAIVTVYFGSDCTRPYMVETVSTFTQDAATSSFHLIANAVYTGPTGTPLGSIAFNEFANNIDFVGDRLVGSVNGLGVYTSLAGAPSVQLGLNCDFSTPNHNVALCQGGIAQDVPEVSQAIGSVTTLALDSTATGALNFTGNSILTSGPVGSLTLTAPSTLSMVVQGGSTYGNATAAGSAATFSLFPPTPTGWSVTDTARDAVFRIDVIDNTTRSLSGTIKRISTGATLASFALDQSGTGTITWSDGSTAPVVGWTTR